MEKRYGPIALSPGEIAYAGKKATAPPHRGEFYKVSLAWPIWSGTRRIRLFYLEAIDAYFPVILSLQLKETNHTA